MVYNILPAEDLGTPWWGEQTNLFWVVCMEARENEATGIVPFNWQEKVSPEPVEIARFMSKFGNAEMLSVIACENGCYDILRNGKSIAPHPWKPNELDDCVKTLCQLTGTDLDVSGL